MGCATRTVEHQPSDPRDDVARNGAAALTAVLKHLRRAESEVEAFTAARATEIRHAVDQHILAMDDEVGRARQLVAEAGGRADRRLRESVARVAAGHAVMKHRFDAAMRKPDEEARSEARGLLASTGRAVRDSLLILGGPIDTPFQ